MCVLLAEIGWLEAGARLCMAILAGAVLGFEREARSKPAGLRTHMLVSLGAALFMVLAVELMEDYANAPSAIRLDAMRVLGGIIGGIGFLGGGAILEARGSIRGLTTAATIWMTSAIGAACGLGYYPIAGMAVGLSLTVLILVGLMERKFFPEDKSPSPPPET